MALVFGDGTAPPRSVVDELLDGTAPGEALVVAADGGARNSLAAGLIPTVVVGDGDSLPASVADDLRARGVAFLEYPRDKDSSDTELAVREALRRGATEVRVLGAFGGRRIEHMLANVLLLAQPDMQDADVALVDELTTVRVLGDAAPRALTLNGRPGDFVSLLPLTESVGGITTRGLAFALDDEDLPLGSTRGLSNEMISDAAWVDRRSGCLAVIHTRRASDDGS